MILNILKYVIMPDYCIGSDGFSDKQNIDFEASQIDMIAGPEGYFDLIAANDSDIDIAPIVIHGGIGERITCDPLVEMIDEIGIRRKVEFRSSDIDGIIIR